MTFNFQLSSQNWTRTLFLTMRLSDKIRWTVGLDTFLRPCVLISFNVVFLLVWASLTRDRVFFTDEDEDIKFEVHFQHRLKVNNVFLEILNTPASFLNSCPSILLPRLRHFKCQ